MNQKKLYFQESPIRLVLIMTISIFVSEMVVMVILNFLTYSSLLFEVLIDSTILVIILSPIFYLIIFRPLVIDIIERKQVEESLRVSEERFRNISTLAHDAILMMDPQENISYWNNAAERMFGYKQKEAVGKDLHQLIVPVRYHDKFKRGYIEFQKNGQGAVIGQTRELAAIRKGGEEFPVELSLSSVRIDGEWNAIGVVRDVTKRKRAETALRDANLLKELLLDTITHDLKNPISVISGFAEIMLNENSDNERLEIIKNCSDQLVQVMDNSTVLTHITLGDEIQKDELNITKIIQSVTNGFTSQLDYAGMTLEVDLPDTLPVQANSIIAYIFHNYISNAIKHAAHGKKIIIDCDESDEYFMINVKDYGETIPEKFRQEIFIRSFQIDTNKPGRGLGLSIVKRIADAHYAVVGVKPNEPTGNIFYIKIPLK